MPGSWEDNHRSGVALATRQTLVVLHLWAQGLEEGDENPMVCCGAWLTLPLPLPVGAISETCRIRLLRLLLPSLAAVQLKSELRIALTFWPAILT